MKLLVTGGAGYVGSVVAEQLVEAGHTVTILDDLSRGHRDAIPHAAQLVEADLLDARATHNALRPGFDGVLHFAALSLVADSVRHPEVYGTRHSDRAASPSLRRSREARRELREDP